MVVTWKAGSSDAPSETATLPSHWPQAPRRPPIRFAPGQTLDAQLVDRAVVFVLSGWLCRARLLPNGRRQIVELLLPGDHHFGASHPSSHEDLLTAVSRCEVVHAPVAEVRDAMDASGALRAEMAGAERRRCAILEEHLVNLGQRNALERMAHLLCEVMTRAEGSGSAGACELPLTQGDLADTLGLSTVHTSRILQELRRRGLATVSRGRLAIHDRDELAALAGFSPAYLRPAHRGSECLAST